jgi:hypothetical protein
MTMEPTEAHLAGSIVYLCALLADRPRLIDRYLDYFGGSDSMKASARIAKPGAKITAAPSH